MVSVYPSCIYTAQVCPYVCVGVRLVLYIYPKA